MRQANKEYNLQILNKNLSEEWHPTKNGKLTPRDVTPNSHKKVWWICQKGHEWDAVVKNRSRGGGCPYCSGRKVCQDNCLQTLNPALASQWHPTKNGKLTPSEVTPGSDKEVWWICEKGHEWNTRVHICNRGDGCPYCSGRKLCNDNCLETLNPALASQWHPTKNGKLTPRDVTARSSRKFWWICEKGHEWSASLPNRRNGDGCPYCSGRRVCQDNCLQTLNPVLASQWHPSKNGKLTPSDVTPNSHKRVWWICEKGHEWDTRVQTRHLGRNCPYCSGQRTCNDNCLQTLNPALASQWHATKNGELTPKDVTPGSTRKVWWICERGHEWAAAVADRNAGTRCPYCYSQTSQLELRLYTEMKYFGSSLFQVGKP